MQRKAHADQRWGCVSYAQHGDDFMILNIFEMLKIDRPTYLDLGAHHPENISNTKLLYDRGCRGINVEANPHLLDEFKRFRPEDINLNIGVGPESGTFDFKMYDSRSGRNTFSDDEVKEYGRTVKSVMPLPVLTLTQIVDRYNTGRFPNLLSVDIEGLDYEVLKSTSFIGKCPPDLIVVETRRKKSTEMIAMMGAKGYLPYCRMGENIFFIRKEALDLLY